MGARTVELTVTSLRQQDVTLMARHGIEAITAPAGVIDPAFETGMADVGVHLPANRAVTFRLTLGHRRPFDWCAAERR